MRKLCEWKDCNGNVINPSTSSTSKTPSSSSSANNSFYRDKFEKLLKYHIAHPYLSNKIFKQDIEKLSEDDSKALFKYVEEYITNEAGNEKCRKIIMGAVYYKKSCASATDKSWFVVVYLDGVETVYEEGKGFNNLIAELSLIMAHPDKTSAEYKDLLESADTSFAEDFKLYESLWTD